MNMPVRGLVAVLLFGVLITGGIALLRYGIYGWTVFVLLPALLGGVAATIFRATTAWHGAGLGALALAGSSLLLLLLGREGLLCIGMALPLVVPLGALGGALAYCLKRWWTRITARSVTMLLVLPAATLAWDAKAPAPLYRVRTEILIRATPEQTWKRMIVFPDLPDPQEWFFRMGLAFPKRAHIARSGTGAVRYCEFSTGAVVEPIEVWDEPRLLRFRVSESPAPMHEWSPYSEIQPKHLHGYLVSKEGQFRLTRLANGYTLLEGTTWYQHGLWPAEYWRWWSDAIIHRIHLRVLNHIRTRAEKDAGGSW